MSSDDYAQLAELFLELRNRGVSLSSTDLDILKSWQQQQVSPRLIAQIMLEQAEECKRRSKIFPTTLLPVSRRLLSALKKAQEL